jgi:transcriptional regulator with XRE-family HTH domain
MATTERAADRGTLRGRRWLSTLAAEFRNARLQLGLSQQVVADAARIDRATYSLIEHAKLDRLSIVSAARIASVLGLDLFVGLYQGAHGLRDEASARLITRLVHDIAAPLRYRTEAPLPTKGGRPEQRRWDLVANGSGKRTKFEFETRLYDAQAQLGRINLKRRDDPPNAFVLVIADTRRNREVLRTHPDLFSDLPRLKTASVLKMLRAGRHPPTGWILLEPLRPATLTEQQESRTDTNDKHENGTD